jgi:hypothetical protein
MMAGMASAMVTTLLPGASPAAICLVQTPVRQRVAVMPGTIAPLHQESRFSQQESSFLRLTQQQR